MIRAFDGKIPRIAASSFVSEFAYVIGDVEIGENSGVWPGAVIRGDLGSIRIGRDCQIEDNSIIHSGAAMEIGDSVVIGHSAVVHGLKIGNGTLIGNGATILDFAEIGEHCIVAANSVVATGQKIPSNSFVAGMPAEIKRELLLDEMKKTFLKIADKYSRLSAKEVSVASYTDLVRKYKEQGL